MVKNISLNALNTNVFQIQVNISQKEQTPEDSMIAPGVCLTLRILNSINYQHLFYPYQNLLPYIRTHQYDVEKHLYLHLL